MHDGEKSGDNNTLILGLALVGTYYYFNNYTNSEVNYDNGIPLYKNKTIQVNLLPKSKNLTMSEPAVSLTQEKYIKFYKTFHKKFKNDKNLIHCLHLLSDC